MATSRLFLVWLKVSKKKNPARLQHPRDLLDHLSQILDVLENVDACHEVENTVLEGNVLADSLAVIDAQVGGYRVLPCGGDGAPRRIDAGADGASLCELLQEKPASAPDLEHGLPLEGVAGKMLAQVLEPGRVQRDFEQVEEAPLLPPGVRHSVVNGVVDRGHRHSLTTIVSIPSSAHRPSPNTSAVSRILCRPTSAAVGFPAISPVLWLSDSQAGTLPARKFPFSA